MTLNFPTSAKLWGCNIVPTVAECATGALAWKNLHVNWTTDWPTWIKKQIDYVVGNKVGARCIRMIGDYLGVFDGTFSQATYIANWCQLLAYCAGLGVYVYVTCGDQNQVGSMTNAQIYGQVNALLAGISAYNGTIIGVDVMQEQNAWADADSAARTIAIYNGVKAGGTTLPLTFSTYGILTDSGTKSWIASISSALDFLDFHYYQHVGYDATNPLDAADFNFYRNLYPTLDIFAGEFGSAASQTPDQQESFDRSIFRAHNIGDAKIRGALAWTVQAQSATSSSDWGFYDSVWTPRPQRIRPLVEMTGGYSARAN